jgi:hypothetical protein
MPRVFRSLPGLRADSAHFLGREVELLMTDYTRAVYDYLRTLGDVGEVVPTAIHPYLMNGSCLAAQHVK